MHQDQRIGLALGVLLVGACAAFFFRYETRVLPSAPRLQHARELDERIAERSTRPYMKGIEAIEVADRRRSRASGDQEQSAQDASPEQNATYSWNPLTMFTRKGASENSAREPKRSGKTLTVESDIQEFAPIAVPSHPEYVNTNAGDNKSPGNSNQSIPEDFKLNPSAGEAVGRTYIVQKGESLSSIAAKLLGDRSRFQELFDANQDQLSDPNDVKVGMELHIPGVQIELATRSLANRSRSTTGRTAAPVEQLPSIPERRIEIVPPVVDINPNAIRTVPFNVPPTLLPPQKRSNARTDSTIDSSRPEVIASPRRFVPARRSPLPPRQVGPQSKANGQSDVAGRKLSQISLESTSGKIAR